MDSGKENMRITLRLVAMMLLVAAAIVGIFSAMASPWMSLTPFDKDIMNFYLNDELRILPISFVMLAGTWAIAHRTRLAYFNFTRRDAAVAPDRLLGVTRPDKERWESFGLSVGLIITGVTAIVMYYIVARQDGFLLRLWPEAPLILLFAAMNALAEELIFRLSFVIIGASEKLPQGVTLLLGSMVFGIVHDFGIAPNGIIGVLMSAYIGYFLTKSMLETCGFFWAWFIHFLQDVVILFFAHAASLTRIFSPSPTEKSDPAS